MKRGSLMAGYIGSILLANLLTSWIGLVPIGAGLYVTAGTFAAGLALVLRDGIQETWTRDAVLTAILAGTALSYVIADHAIAAASAVAFLASEAIDWAIYSNWRSRSKPAAVIASSVIAAPFDTVLFLAIAGFPVTVNAVIGQMMVKTLIALAVSVGLVMKDAVPVRYEEPGDS